MSEPCLQLGHTGAANTDGEKQMKSLKDVTSFVEKYFKKDNPTFKMERQIKNNLVPGGLAAFSLTSAGEAVYYCQGLPIAIISRLNSESGTDANVGKWYRKQWFFENHLKKQNPHCTHITFVSGKPSILKTIQRGVSMVMTQSFNKKLFNEHNHGGNSIFCSESTDTWYDMQAKIVEAVEYNLNEIAKAKKASTLEDAYGATG